MIDTRFWNGKKVLVTGHTGFKGGWLSAWLTEMGAEVVGYALDPDTEPSFFELVGLKRDVESVIGDVREKDRLLRVVRDHRPEILFHLAAQSLVRRSYQNPVETLETNVMGTVHLLEAARLNEQVRVVVNITSDKCYENKEWIWPYREEDPVGGHDPYSSSKGCAELVTSAYRRSFFESGHHQPSVATARAGNVIGGGDWAEDRLFPDAVRALRHRKPLVVRNPRAVRPWQHVLEPLHGYLMLAEKLYGEKNKWAGAWNFGPEEADSVTVADLADMIMKDWGEGSWKPAPEERAPHEARTLRLDSSKSRLVLGWSPRLSLEESVGMTVEWYREAVSSKKRPDMRPLTREQIKKFESRVVS